jgi:hypothetical protein
LSWIAGVDDGDIGFDFSATGVRVDWFKNEDIVENMAARKRA